MRAVNLIPDDQRAGAGAGAGRSGGAAYVVLGLLGVLAIFALLYGLASHQVSSRKAQIASLNTRAQQAQAHAIQLSPYTSFVAMRQQREQAVSQLVDSRFDWAHAFHELGRVLPFNVSLTSLTGTVGSTTSTSGAAKSSSAATGASATATSATPPGSVPIFTIAGCASSQAAVARTLNRLRLIDGVSEVALQSSIKSAATGGGGASGGGGAGGCEGGDAAFTAQVTFAGLPSVPAVSSTGSKTTVSASAGGAASATGAAR